MMLQGTQNDVSEVNKLLKQSIDQQYDNSTPINGPENSCAWMAENYSDIQQLSGDVQENAPEITPSARSFYVSAQPLIILKEQDGSEVKGLGIESFNDGKYEAVDNARPISTYYPSSTLNIESNSRYQQILKCISDGDKLVVFFPERPLPIGTIFTQGNFETPNGNRVSLEENSSSNSIAMETAVTSVEIPSVMEQDTLAQPSTSRGINQKRKRSTKASNSASSTKIARLFQIRTLVDQAIADEEGTNMKKNERKSSAAATTSARLQRSKLPNYKLTNMEEATNLEAYLSANENGHEQLVQELTNLTKKNEKCNSPKQAAGLLLNGIFMTSPLRCKFNWAGQNQEGLKDPKVGLSVKFPAITKVLIDAIRDGWNPIQTPTDGQIEDIIKEKLKPPQYKKTCDQK